MPDKVCLTDMLKISTFLKRKIFLFAESFLLGMVLKAIASHLEVIHTSVMSSTILK